MTTQFPNLSLSVVLPAYNEERLLASTLQRTVEALARSVDQFEVLLIDDCSTDGTPALADALGREFPQVQVIHNPRNLKQGGCLKLGFDRARYELVMHNAIDYPFDFADLPIVLQHFPAADVVVVTRASYPGVTAARRFVSWGNRSLIRRLFGLGITDYNFVQVFRRSVLMQQHCFSTSTAFMTVERIIRAHHAGYRVVAVAAEYRRRIVGASSSGTLGVVANSLRDMARLWFELRVRSASKKVDVDYQGNTP